MNILFVMGAYTAICFCGLIGLDYVTADYLVTNKTDERIIIEAFIQTNILKYQPVIAREQKVLDPHQYATFSVGTSALMGAQIKLVRVTAAAEGGDVVKDKAELSDITTHFLAVRREDSGKLVLEHFVR